MSIQNKENIEIELKLALPCFADYLKLVGYIGVADCKTHQTNIFYDTTQMKISELGYALRLRIEPAKGVITLKSTTEQAGNAAIRKEIEEVITLEQALHIQEENSLHSLDIPAVQFLRTQVKELKDIKPIVQFENNRLKKAIKLNDISYIFEVDKTTYKDGSVIYELEVELEKVEDIENATFNIKKLFSILEIEFIAMKKSKFERALEIAEQI